MLKRLLIAALLCVPWAGNAVAQQAVRVTTCNQTGVAPPNVSPLFVDANGNLCTTTQGGGGSSGAIGAAGVNGATAQSVQGVTGGAPVPVSATALPLPTGAATSANQATPTAAGTSGSTAEPVQGITGGVPVATVTNPGTRTLVALDVATVTTGGTAVTALAAGHRSAGGFLFNPNGATINLCINEIGTASGATSAGSTTCILPGVMYSLAPAAGAVSVISSDSAHAFSGYGLN